METQLSVHPPKDTVLTIGHPAVPKEAAAVIEYLLDDRTNKKLKTLFNFFDVNADGDIRREEFVKVLASCAEDIGLDIQACQDLIVDAVFSNAQLTSSGTITFRDLKDLLKQRPTLLERMSSNMNPVENLTVACVDTSKDNHQWFPFGDWLSMLNRRASLNPQINHIMEEIRENLASCRFSLALLLILTGLYLGRIYTYWHTGKFMIMARASGQCLNFLSSIVALLVCRRSISFLRSKGFATYLPLDEHIHFHKLVGYSIVGHSVLHITGHLLHTVVVRGRFVFTLGVNRCMSTFGTCAILTGWILLIILVVMTIAYPLAMKCNNNFDLFYYTHLLYIPFWVLLLIHAPHFWIWFMGPLTIFTLEMIIRLRTLLTTDGETTITRGVPLPNNVLHLVIKRPEEFHFNPGDWIYVRVPTIAKYDWHPFTISSAPEQEDVIWLHIRAVGNWTKSLRGYFEGCNPGSQLSRFIRTGTLMSDQSKQCPLDGKTKIFIDGPYGAPASQIFRCEHAVLIATGIGVTPFASILQSIMLQYERRRQRCPSCTHEFVDSRYSFKFNLRKVDFVWINRDQDSFEWFIKLLAELELAQSHIPVGERLLTTHIYMTTSSQTAETKLMGLKLALGLVHEKNNKDLITGLKTLTNIGRPVWDSLFEEIDKRKQGKVSVFFCGTPQLGKQLQNKCEDFNFEFKQETF